MWIAFAILSAIIFGTASVIMKAGTIRKYSDYYILWGLYASGSIFFFISAHGNYNFKWSITLVIASIIIAIGSFFGNYFVIKALETGPASLTAPMLNINLPLIILMSVIYYGETMTATKIIIILLLFIAVLLVKFDPHENLSIKNKKWFVWVISGAMILFLREGGLKITLELGLNNQIILLNSYIICLIFATISLFKIKVSVTEENSTSILQQHLNAIKFGLYAGVCSGGGLFLYSLALSTGPASLVALIFSARSIVIIFFSALLFKEKLTKFQKFSVILLCLGLALSSFT
jgi:drug/metabolite transporter (DMT)-like permease